MVGFRIQDLGFRGRKGGGKEQGRGKKRGKGKKILK
jgi:hypothetical protein